MVSPSRMFVAKEKREKDGFASFMLNLCLYVLLKYFIQMFWILYYMFSSKIFCFVLFGFINFITATNTNPMILDRQI